MTHSSFASDLPRNLTIKCSLFCTKFILKNLYLAKNNLYKKPLFLRETARGLQFFYFSFLLLGVNTCLEFGSKVCEEAFEVQGTSTNPNSQAPYKGRMNRKHQVG